MNWLRSLFRCRHPFAYLAVEKEATVEPFENPDYADSEKVTIHLCCMRCKTLLDRTYAREKDPKPISLRTKTNR